MWIDQSHCLRNQYAAIGLAASRYERDEGMRSALHILSAIYVSRSTLFPIAILLAALSTSRTFLRKSCGHRYSTR